MIAPFRRVAMDQWPNCARGRRRHKQLRPGPAKQRREQKRVGASHIMRVGWAKANRRGTRIITILVVFKRISYFTSEPKRRHVVTENRARAHFSQTGQNRSRLERGVRCFFEKM